nr:vegetative cell wall protein gp1-like [Aegilops tauschii subsp. strangulata]
MSQPPPSLTLSSGSTAAMTTAPPLTAPMTSAAGTTALAGHVSTGAPPAPPSPVPSAPPPSAVFTPEQVTATLRDLVTAVQSLHLQQQQYVAGPYMPLPTAPVAAYGHTPWPLQGVSPYDAPLMLPFQAAPPGGPPAAAAPLWPFAPTPSAPPWPLQQPFSAPSPSLISSGTTAPACTGLPLLPSQAGHSGGTTPAAAPLWYLQPPSPAATDATAHPPPPMLQPPAPPLPSSGAPSSTGLPIHQVRFPPSPSPLPAWAAGSSPSPVYTTAPE